MRKKGLWLWVLLCCSTAHAGESWLDVELPTIDVAEYHRPYVAIWIQGKGSRDVHNVAVWYQLRDGSEKGEEWLKDMRQWWRRSGRGLDMPVDGISGATKAPGQHRVELNTALQALPAGDYLLNVEAAREVGGRELLKIPFSWPAKATQSLSAQGETELGRLQLHLEP